MTFSPPNHLRLLTKPAVISKEQRAELLDGLRTLADRTANGIADWARNSSLRDLLKFEAFRSFRLARVTNTTFMDLDAAPPLNTLVGGASRQSSLIANTLEVHSMFEAEIWKEVGKTSLRSFYRIWLQEEVQFKHRSQYPDSI